MNQEHAAEDFRHIGQGKIIPTNSYADQPYIVETDDGAWLCVATTGCGHEGARGQHVISMRSTDCGETWSEAVAVEEPGEREASYAVLLKTPYGRIYCFYNHNTDNVRRARAENPPFETGYSERVDSLGHFVFKYTDDGGRSWSEHRYDVPMRLFEIDRENPYNGKLLYFWNVGKPFVFENAGYILIHKVGSLGLGFFSRSEGALLCSKNILSERDPSKIIFETLPDGEIGLRAPENGGKVAEEQSFSVLSDGSFFVVYRTIAGHPAVSYSRDKGHTWSAPEYMRYADGRPVKQPRAANFAWKCKNGKFIYWYHNNGGRGFEFEDHWTSAQVVSKGDAHYEDRNPAFVLGGEEVDGPDGKLIRWSQPELLIYDDDPYIRMSYPDLVEQEQQFYFTETQKHTARVHRFERAFFENLWAQFGDGKPLPAADSVLTKSGDPVGVCFQFSTRDYGDPSFCKYDLRGYYVLVFDYENISEGDVLFDTTTRDGRGMRLRVEKGYNFSLCMSDGMSKCVADTAEDFIEKTGSLAVVLDGGAKIVSFIVDGKFCDGADNREFGWQRFSPDLYHANGEERAKLSGAVKRLRIYDGYLQNSQIIGDMHCFRNES